MWLFFELAGPLRLLPRYKKSGNMRRIQWLLFSFGFVDMKLNDFIDGLIRVARQTKPQK